MVGGVITLYVICTLLVSTIDVVFVVSPFAVELLTSSTDMTLILSVVKNMLMKPVVWVGNIKPIVITVMMIVPLVKCLFYVAAGWVQFPEAFLLLKLRL